MDFRANDGSLDPADVEVRTLAGRDYLVAPTVLVKEGDLNGGYMPAAELEASVAGWNGVPVTVDHPTDDNGDFVPANQPEFIDTQGLGHVYNVEYDDEIRGLRGEMWVDINRARDLDGDARSVAERLAYHTDEIESNADVGLLEVSTGYFHNVEQTANGVTQTDVLPDHLAALPNDTGACSVEDGCGAPRVTANAVRSSARDPDYSGTESSEWSAPTLEDYVSGYDLGDVSSVDDLGQDDKALIASKTLLGDGNATSFNDLSFFPVVNPSTDALNENALEAVIGGRGAQADIPDDAESSAQSTSRSLLNSAFDRDVDQNKSQSETPAANGSFVTRLANGIASAFSAPDAPAPDTVTANEQDTSDTMSNFDFERLSTASGIPVESLREMDEQSLSVIERGANADDENGDDETDPDEEPADDDTPGEETDPLEALAANCGNGTGNMDALVDRITEQVAANVTEQVESDLEARSERQQKEAFIAANSSYELDDLADYDDGEIDRLAEFVETEHDTPHAAQRGASQRVGANYAGRGVPSSDDEKDDDDRADVLSTYSAALGKEADD